MSTRRSRKSASSGRDTANVSRRPSKTPPVTLGTADHATASFSKVGTATRSSQPGAQGAPTRPPGTPPAPQSKRKRENARDENDEAPSSPPVRSVKRLKADSSRSGQQRPVSKPKVDAQDDGEKEGGSTTLRDFDVNSKYGEEILKADHSKEEDLSTPKAKGKQGDFALSGHHGEKRSEESLLSNDDKETLIDEWPASPSDPGSPRSSQDSGIVQDNTDRAVYRTSGYPEEEVFFEEGRMIRNGQFEPSQSSGSEGSSSQDSELSFTRVPKFSQYADWEGPPSQPSRDDDDSDESQEIDYGSTPPE
ncbi:hypothetical protein MD484_g1519, partial [Candolleomyces efflorescens]